MCSAPSPGPTQQSIDRAGLPDAVDQSDRATVDLDVVLDTVSGAAQREARNSAMRLPFRKKLAAARFGLDVAVRLAGPESGQQLVRGGIDEGDFVGTVEGVRQCLPHPDARDPAHHVVEALEVLDVERGPDVESLREQLLDVLAFAQGSAPTRRRWYCASSSTRTKVGRRVSAASRSNSERPGSAPESSDFRGRLQPRLQGRRLGPAVGLDEAEPATTSIPVLLQRARAASSICIGLADASR